MKSIQVESTTMYLVTQLHRCCRFMGLCNVSWQATGLFVYYPEKVIVACCDWLKGPAHQTFRPISRTAVWLNTEQSHREAAPLPRSRMKNSRWLTCIKQNTDGGLMCLQFDGLCVEQRCSSGPWETVIVFLTSRSSSKSLFFALTSLFS